MKEQESHNHTDVPHHDHTHVHEEAANMHTTNHAYHTGEHSHHRSRFVLTTPLAIIISGAIIACGIMGYGLITRTSAPAVASALFAGKPIDSQDYIEGKASSDVILVEYSDSECPYCMQVHPTIKQLRTEYADKVAFVYRYFPLTQIHPHAYDEARAIACAGKIGGTKKFYEYIDAIFGYKIEKKTTQLSATGKEDLARSIGLDNKTFLACMSSGETRVDIDNSLNDGITAGVQGTPASFVLVKTKKGYEVLAAIDGARPYEYFKAAIEQALAK